MSKEAKERSIGELFRQLDNQAKTGGVFVPIPPEIYGNTPYQPLERRVRDIETRQRFITAIAPQFFDTTALTISGQEKTGRTNVTQEDINTIFQFLETAGTILDSKINDAYWPHIMASYARSVAISEIFYGSDTNQQYLFQSRLLLHDVGRLFCANEYGLNDILAEEFLTELGFTEDFLRAFLPLDRVIGYEQPAIDTALEYDLKNPDINMEIILFDVADNVARFSSKNRLASFQECIAYASGNKTRYKWSSYSEAIERLLAQYEQDGETIRYVTVLNLLKQGINFFEKAVIARDKTLKSFEQRSQEVYDSAIVQDHLQILQQRRLEKVQLLDKEKPIHTILFDIGSVIIDDADEAFFTASAEKLSTVYQQNITTEQVRSAVIHNIDHGMTAKTLEEQETYLLAVYRALGITLPHEINHLSLSERVKQLHEPFLGHIDIYKFRNKVVRFIQETLATRPDINIIFLTDCVAGLDQVVKDVLYKKIPELKAKRHVHFFSSAQLGMAKRQRDNNIFKHALAQANIPQSQWPEILFIDDKPGYTADFRSLGGKTLTWILGDSRFEDVFEQLIQHALN